jgi:tetratricopeptide (TPR) repeat protein
MKTPALLAASALCLLTSSRADPPKDYQGADAVLKQTQDQLNSPEAAPPKVDPVRQWRADIKSYGVSTDSLTPDQAAKEWLALFDRASKLPPSSEPMRYWGPPQHLSEVFAVLPPPAVWDALVTQVAARQLPAKGSADFSTAVLRVVAGALQDKPDAIQRGIDALNAQVADLGEQQQSMYALMVDGVEDAFLAQGGDKQGALAIFEAKLARLSRRDAQIQGINSLEVPNLAELAGGPKAQALLKQMFALPLQSVTFKSDKTKALARQVALEMGDELKFAPWSLVDTLDSTSLYEVLSKQFPRTPQDQYNRREADAYDLLGLVSQRRYDEAAKQAVAMGQNARPGQGDALANLPGEALTDLAEKGYAEEVYQFFDRFLAAHPELPYWRSYTEAAVLAGKAEDMLSHIKAAGERADLPPNVKSAVHYAYGEALLAAGQPAEALPILRESVASMRPVTVPGGPESGDLVRWALAAAKLAAAGQLLDDQPLVNEQLDAFASAAQVQPDIIGSIGDDNVVDIFLSAGRGPELERLLAGSLLLAERAATTNLARVTSGVLQSQRDYYFQSARTVLYALADLYFRAGRYQDVVALLSQARYWGAADIGGLLVSRYGNGGRFGYQAARALQETGDRVAALRLVNAYLERHGGSDPAYELLLTLLPPDEAEARLDALFQGDQFEERPLIWRAVLQYGQGRLDEAEKSARQAISIDPSDGEEGRGDRMRAYAVLGDILEREGQPEKAAQMREAVKAIRLSEDADRFHAAGLLTRAVGMYEKALGYFADAYCIQSRLAVQLVALGKLDEAMPHYERAYELMPASFGRMESHCFGCERAFAGERAQGVAERVFQKFVDQQPANPRVHYLLGYLRMEEDRDAEAAHEFQAAVKLDPDYINAWKQLAANTDDPAVHDEAELNLLRLDPRHRHDSADLSNISDLRALWAAVEAADKFALPEATDLYPLPASKAFLDEERRRHPGQPAEDQEPAAPADFFDNGRRHLTPREAVMQNKVIVGVLQLAPRAAYGVTE